LLRKDTHHDYIKFAFHLERGIKVCLQNGLLSVVYCIVKFWIHFIAISSYIVKSLTLTLIIFTMHFIAQRTHVFQMTSVLRTINSVFISWSTDRLEESTQWVIIRAHFRFWYWWISDCFQKCNPGCRRYSYMKHQVIMCPQISVVTLFKVAMRNLFVKPVLSDYKLIYKTYLQQVLHRFHCDQQFKKTNF
jgi:hypothetical protein